MLKYLNIFKGINRLVERVFKPYLHNKREYYIEQQVKRFNEIHHPPANVLTQFKKKLNTEANRIYTMSDRSILRAQIERAGIAFNVTLVAGEATVAIIAAATGTAFTLVPFITPIPPAIVAWGISLVTIPLFYNQRVKGGLDSVYSAFEKEYLEEKQSPIKSSQQLILSQTLTPNSARKLQTTLDEIKEHLASKSIQDQAPTLANESAEYVPIELIPVDFISSPVPVKNQ